ncbi:MBL fold metallo-hydrolase [Burkholderia ubonensis]|uniref:MBL fold metallo-hydrolase n=1 Tax=Burkholderia ubonensis TaxID=101571 RepID=UPI00016A43D2
MATDDFFGDFVMLNGQGAQHRDGPSRNDPAPSHYALRIGELDVAVIGDDALPLPITTVAINTPAADPATRMNDMSLLSDAFDWPLNVAVVRSGSRNILIDAGLGAALPGFPPAGRLHARLGAAGVDIASVTDVIITHLHMDHIGGLLAEGVKNRLRPDVRIHVSATEIEFWQAPDFFHAPMSSPVPDVHRSAANRFVNDYLGQLRMFDDEYEVALGVVVSRTGGHTPGHCVVRLASAGDRMTFAGDAILPFGFEHPEWQYGIEHDPEESVRIRVRLLQELAASGELLMATHLPLPSIGTVTVHGDAFRWIPIRNDV